MPIYEYYCAENHTIYQFYAKTLAQGQRVPKCPDNPAWPLRRVMSAFTVGSRQATEKRESIDDPSQPPVGDSGGPFGRGGAGGEADDPRMEAAMRQLEGEFAHVDENDPRAMARMMRRMSEVTGEPIDEQMDEVVRKLEEGMSPDDLESRMEELFGKDDSAGEGYGSDDDAGGGGAGGKEAGASPVREARARLRARRAPRRDPQLYDYEE